MSVPSSTVVITYTAPGASSVDITNDVIFSSARFSGQMAATPGEFDITVRDMNQTHSFVTGGVITLDVDSVRMFGGYILMAERMFALPVDNTVSQLPSAVKSRQWHLTGSDYNYLLDKLIFRVTTDYTHNLDPTGAPIYDGEIIRTYFPLYYDLPVGFDVTTLVQDNYQFPQVFLNGEQLNYQFGAGGNGQGFTMRDNLNDLALYGGVFFVNPSFKLVFTGVQNTAAGFAFSDAPAKSHTANPSVTYIGFREGSRTEDLTPVVNDAFVWGGSEWANNGQIVFARSSEVPGTDAATSIATHGRWQYAEVRVGEQGFKLQDGVQARANAIVTGNVQGTNANVGQEGRVLPEVQYHLSWFAHEVPGLAHIPPSYVATLDLWVFSEDGGVTPLTLPVPLRSVTITFPTLEAATGKAYVRFDGMFGVLSTDPEWLWAYLRRIATRDFLGRAVVLETTAGNGTTGAVPYGTLWSGAPTPVPDGIVTAFSIPYGYIAGSTILYVNGLAQRLNTDYRESDPPNGQVTTLFTPVATDTLWLTATLTG